MHPAVLVGNVACRWKRWGGGKGGQSRWFSGDSGDDKDTLPWLLVGCGDRELAAVRLC